MNKKLKQSGAVLTIIVTICLSLAVPPALTAEVLSDADRLEIIDTVLSRFRERYVYPEVAAQMDSAVQTNLEKGMYSQDSTLEIFLHFLRNDLRKASKDRHVWIAPMEENGSTVAEGETVTEEQISRFSLDNFGWVKAEYLPGGVGYLRVDAFRDTAFAARTANTALSQMANSQILIIDLREHHGGEENMQILACSYFFRQPTQISALYWPYLDSTAEAWTLPEVAGTPLYDKEVYLLTSSRTASGAECFAYNLKHAGRATIIGESTAGAAHWNDSYNIPNLGITIYLPVARPINPNTGRSWEGTGVLPDIETPAKSALDVAYLKALESLRKKAVDKRRIKELDWHIVAAVARVNPVEMNESVAANIVGTYTHPTEDADYQVVYDDGKVILIHYRGDRYTLLPLTSTMFQIEGDTDGPRINFAVDDTGLATELQYTFSDGRVYGRKRVTDGD